MSEIVDSYLAQLPEQCRKCPVIGQFVVWANDFEDIANYHSENLAKLNDRPFDSESHRTVMANILAQCTDKELEAIRSLETLIENTDDSCPGTRRGTGVSNASWGMRFFSTVMGEKVCQNPQFEGLQSNPVIGRILYGHWGE